MNVFLTKPAPDECNPTPLPPSHHLHPMLGIRKRNDLGAPQFLNEKSWNRGARLKKTGWEVEAKWSQKGDPRSLKQNQKNRRLRRPESLELLACRCLRCPEQLYLWAFRRLRRPEPLKLFNRFAQSAGLIREEEREDDKNGRLYVENKGAIFVKDH